MENRPKITVNLGLTVPQPGNEGTGKNYQRIQKPEVIQNKSQSLTTRCLRNEETESNTKFVLFQVSENLPKLKQVFDLPDG